MHTYLRFEDGTYTVGQWLPNHEGIVSFHKMFDVPGRLSAIQAVSVLNGGEWQTLNISEEH